MPPTNTSIGDCFKKVKSPHPGTFRLPKVLAVQRWESPRKVFLYLYAVSDQDGFFELDAAKIAQQTGLSRKTVYKAITFLQRVRLLFLEKARTGRGRHSLYRLNWHKRKSPKDSTRKSVTLIRSIKDLKSTHSKDRGRSEGVTQSVRWEAHQGQPHHQSSRPRRDTSFYQGLDAERVCILIGTRFYRSIMQAIRLGLEEWALSEEIRDALEGLYGRRIDGASLAYARELRDRIWTLRTDIERLAASGASPRRVCSFVAGRLAGIPECRSKREVIRRTADILQNDPLMIDRRITGLRTWLKEREQDYLNGQACAQCGYRHSESEYCSGYREDGAGLNCFGFGRIKLDELSEQHKLMERRRREQLCRECGVLLRDGHVEGLCWNCYYAVGRFSVTALVRSAR